VKFVLAVLLSFTFVAADTHASALQFRPTTETQNWPTKPPGAELQNWPTKPPGTELQNWPTKPPGTM